MLSRLPAELRNVIYELAVVELEPIILTSYNPHSEVSTRMWKAPGLLQTCAQIRAEASSVYYEMNTFNCGPQREFGEINEELCDWSVHIDSKQRRLVRTVQLDDSWYPADKIDEEVAFCKRQLEKRDTALPNVRILLEVRANAAVVWYEADAGRAWVASSAEARQFVDAHTQEAPERSQSSGE